MAAKKTGIYAVFIIGMSLLLISCGHRTHGGAQAAARGVYANAAKPEYMVGIDASYAPFEYIDHQHTIQGFDVDLLRAVAAREGFKVKFVNTPWSELFGDLLQGDRDLLASAIGITDERRQNLRFSAPYFSERQAIVVARGATQISRFDDLKGRRIALQSGGDAEMLLPQRAGFNRRDLKSCRSLDQALRLLERGEVLAVVGDNGVLLHLLLPPRGLRLRLIEDQSGMAAVSYGFALRPDDSELQAKLDHGLAALKADGSYQSLYARYFGSGR